MRTAGEAQENRAERRSVAENSVPGWGVPWIFRVWWTSRFGYRLPLEMAIVFGVFTAYQAARLLAKNERAAGLANADLVISSEKALGIYNEKAVNFFVIDHRWLLDFLNEYYVEVHFVVTPLVLLWLWFFRHDGYPKVRRVIIGSMAVALVIHLTFPLAPPWMVGAEGFIDTLEIYGQDIHNNGNPAVNRVAAMPSLHFGWAALVAAAMIMNRRSPIAWIWVAHPLITLFAIVATANHYWADAAVGGGIIAVLYALDARWEAAGGLARLPIFDRDTASARN